MAAEYSAKEGIKDGWGDAERPLPIGRQALCALTEKTVYRLLGKGCCLFLPGKSVMSSLAAVEAAVCTQNGMDGICVVAPGESAVPLLELMLPRSRVFRRMHAVCAKGDEKRVKGAIPEEWGLWTIDGGRASQVRKAKQLRLDKDALVSLFKAGELRTILIVRNVLAWREASRVPLSDLKALASRNVSADVLCRAAAKLLPMREHAEPKDETGEPVDPSPRTRPALCPQCRSKGFEVLNVLLKGGGNGWVVRCSVCRTSTAPQPTKEAAMEAWNVLGNPPKDETESKEAAERGDGASGENGDDE